MKRWFKYLLLLPPLLLCAAAVCLSHSAKGRTQLRYIRAETEDARLAWLSSQGIEAERISSQAVTVPRNFSGAYQNYAALQAQLQLPLKEYAGQRAVMYTYSVTGSEPLLYAELLTAEGFLIGVQCYYPEEGAVLDLQGAPFTAAEQE